MPAFLLFLGVAQPALAVVVTPFLRQGGMTSRSNTPFLRQGGVTSRSNTPFLRQGGMTPRSETPFLRQGAPAVDISDARRFGFGYAVVLLMALLVLAADLLRTAIPSLTGAEARTYPLGVP